MPAKNQLSGVFVKCENCGKEVYKTKSQYNKARHHFCSTKCQKELEHKQKYEDRECEICGKLFHIRKSSVQRFCSVECQRIWQTRQIGMLHPKNTKIEISCEQCGEKYLQNPNKVSKQHNFCSNTCRQAWYATVFSQNEKWKEESKRRAVRMLESKQVDTNTKPQQIINDILKHMSVSYVNEKGFKYYAVDNYLSDYNLIIEVMGDFWHCHPQKYNDKNMKDIHKKRIPKDKAKHTYFKNNYNIEILYLWEDDIYNNLDVCQKLIYEYIKSNGALKNYHSFNYHLENNNLVLNKNIIIPYQDVVNA